MSRCAVVFLVLAACKQGLLADNPKVSEEARLEAYLFKNYDLERRPVKNHTKAVNVIVQISPVYLKVDEVADTITVQNLLIITWRDEFFSWNPANFSGVDYLPVNSAKLWQPQLYLRNADIRTQGSDARFATTCYIYTGGTVRCVPHVSHTGICKPDPRRWPYDSRNCTLVFSSSVHNGELINITFASKPADDGDYYINREWALSEIESSRNPGILSSNSSIPLLHYSFLLRRRSASHAAIVIVPAICLALLTVACGLLEPGTLRLGVALTSLLIQIIYLMGISRYVPSHGDYPAYIIMFFRDSVLITTVTILTTMAMMSVTKFTRTPPRLVAIVVSIAKTGPAKIVNFGEFNPIKISPIVAEEGENNSRTEQERTANMEWQMFAAVFNDLFFMNIAFTYALLICIYVLF